MEELNHLARIAGLAEYKTYSRIWEYPWVWFRLQPFAHKGLQVLDVGSERSPFPWFLCSQGFDVIVSDVSPDYWGGWKEASHQLGVKPALRILDSQNLAVATGSVDIYQSISIIEHVPNKAATIREAARVLKPNGLLLLTFDVCEAEMGMSFPKWNGQALTMSGLDQLLGESKWFEPGLSHVEWNVGSIPEYLTWVRTTAAHHNYVCGAVTIRRTAEVWSEPYNRERTERTVKREATLRTLTLDLRWRARRLKSWVSSHLP